MAGSLSGTPGKVAKILLGSSERHRLATADYLASLLDGATPTSTPCAKTHGGVLKDRPSGEEPAAEVARDHRDAALEAQWREEVLRQNRPPDGLCWPSVVDEDASRWAAVVAEPRGKVNF